MAGSSEWGVGRAACCVRVVRGTVATMLLASTGAVAQTVKKAAPAPKVAAPRAAAPTAAKPGAAAGSHGTGATTPTRAGATGRTATARPGTSEKLPGGGTQTTTARGAVVTKSATGRVESVKTPSGKVAQFGSNGKVREVKDPARNMTVSRGPGGIQRTEIDRPDHSKVVADGRGRGYIQQPYSYNGHSYYSRTTYVNNVTYNTYYRGYYYNGVYLNGYMPAYYYPPMYYGWAYNPWPAPVAYTWGWAGNPWYGYYGGYFAPYPVYPSASYWLADYLVATSLANAYAALPATARLHPEGLSAPRLVYASYDPSTGTTSPTMTKEVKDAVAEEIKSELAVQKAANGDADAASLKVLLADNKPHVFVASSGLTVSSSGEDCALTEGDVLALPKAPAADAPTADLSVMASKKSDCAKGNVVAVQMSDLQDMQNHLLASIDRGMLQMKDHPGQGGLPSPPADAIAGTKAAPYAAAAPAPDPNGAAELDKAAAQGAEVEQQVASEASTDDSGETATAQASAPASVGAPQHSGPVAITLGMTPQQVILAKGQPTNKVNFPNKQLYIYQDMKITFVNGKLTDVQ